MSAAPTSPSQPPSGTTGAPSPQGRRSISTHPLLLAVAPAVAGAIAGGLVTALVTYFGQANGVIPVPSGPSTVAAGTTETPTTSSSPTTTTTSSSPPTTSQPSSAAARPVLYGPNEIRFKSVDLDAVPPAQTGVIGTADLGTSSVTGSSVTFYSYYNSRIAPWDGASPPRPEDCDDRLARLPQEKVNAVAGSTVCVQSGEEAVAAVTLTSMDQEEDAVLASIVVWSGP
jgi:hypothetical protein